MVTRPQVTQILIDCVDRHRHIVSAYVTAGDVVHRVGYLPAEGWFCTCKSFRRCRHVKTIRDMTPPMEAPK